MKNTFAYNDDFCFIFSMEFAKQPADVRKLQQEIKKREWDVSLIDSSQGADSEVRKGPLICLL
jgi:hypothetical protein